MQHCCQQHEATMLLKCCLVYGGLNCSFHLSGNVLPEIGTCSIFWQHVACCLQQATFQHTLGNIVAALSLAVSKIYNVSMFMHQNY